MTLFRLLYRTKGSVEDVVRLPGRRVGSPHLVRVGWLLLPVVAGPAWGAAVAAASPLQACPAVLIEGDVSEDHAYTHPLNSRLDFKLEAVPAGWMIRILPHGGVRPLHDAAELANPPYRSPTPILISTDFAFRAQDAVAWNPRSFRFFTTPEQVATAEQAYQATLREPNRPAAGAALYPLLQQAAEGTLTIVDAEIAGGTANQTAAAGSVASHFDQTAHTARTDIAPSPLGRLLRLRFRLTIAAGELCRGAGAGQVR